MELNLDFWWRVTGHLQNWGFLRAYSNGLMTDWFPGIWRADT